jgi:hypothetical protein
MAGVDVPGFDGVRGCDDGQAGGEHQRGARRMTTAGAMTGQGAGLRVGADTRVITPDLAAGTVFIAGYDPDRPATAVHDELMVRSVAFARGSDEPVVLSVCDLIGMTRVPGPKGRRVVACTHTHHGPDGLGFWGKPFEGVSGIDPAYLAGVRATVEASADAAVAALEPVALQAGSMSVPGLVANFRNPDIVDDELSVVRAVRADGSVVVTLCDFPCHPEVVDKENTELTADFAGHLCRAVEANAGGVAVFAAGALGGMLAPSTEVRTHVEAARYGEVLAVAAEEALASGVHLDGSGVEVAFARLEVDVVLENPIYELGMQIGLVPEAERRADGSVVTEVSCIRVGPAMMACVPGELLPALGLGLKQVMRNLGATVPMVVGLADDELGYLLPADDFTFPADYLDPGAQYEESFSPGPTAGPRVVAALETLLASVAG